LCEIHCAGPRGCNHTAGMGCSRTMHAAIACQSDALSSARRNNHAPRPARIVQKHARLKKTVNVSFEKGGVKGCGGTKAEDSHGGIKKKINKKKARGSCYVARRAMNSSGKYRVFNQLTSLRPSHLSPDARNGALVMLRCTRAIFSISRSGEPLALSRRDRRTSV